jgi:drug/metabolite transporter (DMT)-like permease
MNPPEMPPARRRWPWLVLAGVVLFFLVSLLWLLALVQRVKKIRDAAYPRAHAVAVTNAPATNAGAPGR